MMPKGSRTSTVPPHAGQVTLFILVLSCFGGTGGFAEEMRTWTDQTGSITKQAKLDRVDGNWVHLNIADGGTLRVPLTWLSDADQAFIKSQATTASPREPAGSVVKVAVEGYGLSKEDAENDAYRTAIRQVVGAYVDTKTEVENDQLIRDKVITLSSAYVERVRPIGVSQQNGLVKVKLEVSVRSTKLVEALKQHNVSVTEVDPTALQAALAKAQTQEELQKNRKELLDRTLQDYPENCLKVSVVDKPTFTNTGIEYRIKIEPDMEAFAAVANKICEALGSDGRRQGFLRNDSKYYPNGVAISDNENQRQANQTELVDALSRRFHNGHHITTVDPRGKSSCTLILPPFLSMAMQTPSGLRNPNNAVFVQEFSNDDDLFIPVWADKSLQRIHWRWFAFDRKEMELFLNEHRHAVAVHSVLLDSDGNAVDDDICGISLGWPELFYCRVLSPFFCHQGNGDALYVPSFSFARTIELTAEEVARVRTIRCSVQAAEWPR